MLVSANYWSQFHSGRVGPETEQDLQEICRHCIDHIVKHENPRKIKGFVENKTYTTLEELKHFEMGDWGLLWAMLNRCRTDFKRCFNSYSESLRKSRILDALTAFRAAHRVALGRFQARYQHSMRKLDQLVAGTLQLCWIVACW